MILAKRQASTLGTRTISGAFAMAMTAGTLSGADRKKVIVPSARSGSDQTTIRRAPNRLIANHASSDSSAWGNQNP
jgi:hypothetical protein